MVDHNNLEDSAVAGVTATCMIMITLILLYLIIRYAINARYPPGQKFLIIIFLMPILIG